MSKANFGLVRMVYPSEVYNEAMEVLVEIDKDREEADKERMRNFYIKYRFSFWFRLWNFGFSHAFDPVPKDDLTNVRIIELLDEVAPRWRSEKRYYQYEAVDKVRELAERAIVQKEPTDLFLNEYHFEALRNPEFWPH